MLVISISKKRRKKDLDVNDDETASHVTPSKQKTKYKDQCFYCSWTYISLLCKDFQKIWFLYYLFL